MSETLQFYDEPTYDDAHRQVISVAMKAFYKKGVKSVTMDEIAHELTMSKRTLYQLFVDKEALLLACIIEEHRMHAEMMEERMKQTDNVLELLLVDFSVRLKALKNVAPAFFVDVARFPKVKEKMKNDRLQHREKAVHFLQGGVNQGLFRADVNFDIIFDLFMNQLDNLSQDAQFERYEPIEIFKHCVFFYIRGCTTPKGMAMMDEFLAQM